MPRWPRYLRGVSRLVLLTILAACSGGYELDGPRAPDRFRLVECTPAQPLFVEVDGRVTTHGRLDGEGMGWAGSGATKQAKRIPSVSFSMPSSSGSIDLNAVGRVVRAKKEDLEKCFERELAANPTMSQRVTAWRYSITQDGRVLWAGPLVQSMLAATNECIVRVLRSAAFPPRQTGGTVTVSQSFTADMIQVAQRQQPIVTDKVSWTPFALGAFSPERAATIARAATTVLHGKTDQLAACFGSRTTGALRAVLVVQPDGNVGMARAGGLGDGAIEACMERELLATKVINPGGTPGEITCDFARGDAQPWRVTPSDGYGVITVTRKEMRYGDKAIAVGALEPEALPANATYLIITQPDAPGAIVTSALAWAGEGEASILALQDDVKRSPLYLGMARIGPDDQLSSRPMLVLGRKSVQACLGKKLREGKIADAGKLALELAARCKTTRCGSLVVGIDDLALARDLVEVTGAARRAGFERVVIGGRVTCEKPDEEDDDS
jgi:hypothetical protein